MATRRMLMAKSASERITQNTVANSATKMLLILRTYRWLLVGYRWAAKSLTRGLEGTEMAKIHLLEENVAKSRK